MENLKLKIVLGYEKEQRFTIDADEAHKAYYIFQHPEERGVFNNGFAIVGKYIRSIEPDYNATMGWNPTYNLGNEDWNEIREKNIDNSVRDLMFKAKEIARIAEQDKTVLNKNLFDVIELSSPSFKQLN